MTLLIKALFGVQGYLEQIPLLQGNLELQYITPPSTVTHPKPVVLKGTFKKTLDIAN